MANAEYQAGDKVRVLSGAVMVQEAGLSATIVRKMTDADDYEVEYDQEQLGVSPIVHPDRLLLVSRAEQAETAPAAVETATETAAPAEATPEPAQGDTEASADVPADPAQES
jgi:hypothetical protein